MRLVYYSEDVRIRRLGEYMEKHLEGSDAVFHLLPIPSINGEVVKGTDKRLCELIDSASPGDVFVGYGIPSPLKLQGERRKVRVLDAEDDEIFMDKNARLTAEGTIGRLLSTGERALSDMSVAVIGLGRIGRHLCRMLLSFGMEPVVFSSLPEGSMAGVRILPYARIGEYDFSGTDVLINTAPAPIVKAARAKTLAECFVIELASGENIPRSIKHERFAAVPVRCFPESSALTYTEFFKRRFDIDKR